jgi:hypothetical protein
MLASERSSPPNQIGRLKTRRGIQSDFWPYFSVNIFRIVSRSGRAIVGAIAVTVGTVGIPEARPHE